jgi:hypothetical protein
VSGSHRWGSLNLGGALLTKSGLVFIAGTFDQHLRAFDIETGKELWSAPLPAAAHALPMSYVSGGRQYVVIAAGGHDKLHTTFGDYVLAFTPAGNGAPVPDTTSGRVSGDWTGAMRVGDARFGMHLGIQQSSGDPITVRVRVDSVDITGPVTTRRAGRSVTLSFPIRYAAKDNCTATITTTLSLWNHGTLLEGDGSVDGPCAEGQHQNAAFVFRRSP